MLALSLAEGEGTALGIKGLGCCCQVSAAPRLVIALLLRVDVPFPPCGIPTSGPLDPRTEQRSHSFQDRDSSVSPL